MSNSPKFLVGEKVVRKMDGLVGVVKAVHGYQDSFSYAVDLGREPINGLPDDIWSGTEEAWTPAFHTHAHVHTTSQDCDGKYEHSHVDRPSAIERTSEFGDLEFKERVMCSVVSLHAENGNLNVQSNRMFWTQTTDEGYVHTEVVWCEEDDCEDKHTFRDHTAERAGY